jgi:CXXX repeat radical SAM target protein
MNRRDFFKKATKRLLPIIEMVTGVAIFKAEATPLPLATDCKGQCSSNCSVTCRGVCMYYCDGYCALGCDGKCIGSCRDSCMRSSKSEPDSIKVPIDTLTIKNSHE